MSISAEFLRLYVCKSEVVPSLRRISNEKVKERLENRRACSCRGGCPNDLWSECSGVDGRTRIRFHGLRCAVRWWRREQRDNDLLAANCGWRRVLDDLYHPQCKQLESHRRNAPP